MKKKKKTDIIRDENEDNKENKTERQHLRDKVEGVGEEKRNEIATESRRSRDRDIEDTGLRETDQFNEGREKEFLVDEINLMEFTEIGVEQYIDINKGTETPRVVEKGLGSNNEYEYGKEGEQIGHGARNKNSKEETKRNNERKQRTIDDERVKENFKNKEVREMEAMERDIEREMREEDEKLEERRKKVGIEKVVAEIQREAIDWEVIGDIRREEAELNNRVKEIGIDRTIVEIGEVLRDVRKEGTKLNNRVKEIGIERKIDEIGQRTEIRQEQKSRRRDSDQCREYAREQIKLTNGKRSEKIIIIGDSLMAHGREHLHNYENKYQQCQRATIGFKRGATWNEIIEEVKAIKFDREGGIIVIQGEGNNLTQDGAVLQWFKLMECIGEIWRENEKVTVGIVGITRRTAENREFERQKVRAEDIWSEEIMRWQEERIRNKDPVDG